MNIAKRLKQLLKTRYHISNEKKEFNAIPKVVCEIDNLRYKSAQ